MHPLDNPVWAALTGPQADVGDRRGPVARYTADVSPFCAFASVPDDTAWAAMAELVGPGGVAIVTGYVSDPPEGWAVEYDGAGVQLVGDHLVSTPEDVAASRPDVRLVALGAGDVADMCALVELTRPGPFSPGTWELGGYVGVRVGGRLAAMAGQRFRPAGWCEISAVATHPDHRRHGLAELLVRAVAAGAVVRGETPFLHTAADNAGALRLYRAMGFTERRRVRFVAVRVPGTATGPTPTLPPVHD